MILLTVINTHMDTGCLKSHLILVATTVNMHVPFEVYEVMVIELLCCLHSN
jgi:hypothetical protein